MKKENNVELILNVEEIRLDEADKKLNIQYIYDQTAVKW